MRARSVPALVLSFVLGVGATTTAGCGGAKTDPFTADLRMICSAIDSHRDLPPDLARVTAMRDVASRIKTPEAARLVAAAMQLAPADRAALIAPALAKAGLSRCPTLE